MLFVYTGNGKGKTTTALGQAMRAIGDGHRVLMVQFIKGPWRSGEDGSHKRLAPELKIVKKGRGFVGILGDSLPFEEHVSAAREALEYAVSEARTGSWQIIILDEVNNAVQLKLLTLSQVFDAISEMEQLTEHIICTGRDAAPELIARADLVTEMRDIKHPFYEGTKAKKGVEY